MGYRVGGGRRGGDGSIVVAAHTPQQRHDVRRAWRQYAAATANASQRLGAAAAGCFVGASCVIRDGVFQEREDVAAERAAFSVGEAPGGLIDVVGEVGNGDIGHNQILVRLLE